MKGRGNSDKSKERRVSRTSVFVFLLCIFASIVLCVVGVSSLIGLNDVQTRGVDNYCDTMTDGSDARKLCVSDRVGYKQVYYNIMLNQCLISFSSAAVLIAIAVLSIEKRSR